MINWRNTERDEWPNDGQMIWSILLDQILKGYFDKATHSLCQHTGYEDRPYPRWSMKPSNSCDFSTAWAPAEEINLPDWLIKK